MGGGGCGGGGGIQGGVVGGVVCARDDGCVVSQGLGRVKDPCGALEWERAGTHMAWAMAGTRQRGVTWMGAQSDLLTCVLPCTAVTMGLGPRLIRAGRTRHHMTCMHARAQEDGGHGVGALGSRVHGVEVGHRARTHTGRAHTRTTMPGICTAFALYSGLLGPHNLQRGPHNLHLGE